MYTVGRRGPQAGVAGVRGGGQQIQTEMRDKDGDEVRDMVGSHGARCPDLVTQMGVHQLDTRVPVSLNVAGHWESLGVL